MTWVTRRDLAADPDLEPVGIVVAAIALDAVDALHGNTGELFETGDDGSERMAVIRVAVQRLGVQHELPTLGRGGGRANRHLAAELVTRASRCGAQTKFYLTAVARISRCDPVGYAHRAVEGPLPYLEGRRPNLRCQSAIVRAVDQVRARSRSKGVQRVGNENADAQHNDNCCDGFRYKQLPPQSPSVT